LPRAFGLNVIHGVLSARLRSLSDVGFDALIFATLTFLGPSKTSSPDNQD
jgi:hypothetical protein